jgi:nucleoside-diphosphate-sugar epimerase
MGKRVVLFGGCGYVGENLCISLHLLGYSILVLDVLPLPKSLYSFSKVFYAKCDLTDGEAVDLYIQKFKPVIVVHLASWGMSGSGMLSKRCYNINVLGTENLLSSCLKYNVQNFIYTSTYNVVFGGQPIINGNENLEYFSETAHSDEYSRSKTIAEKIVLQSNGKLMNNGLPLRSSSIRPAAIYGEGEQRHLPRILQHIDMGVFCFKIGSATVDWVHVENLVSITKILCGLVYL